jgi:hypothetical protein
MKIILTLLIAILMLLTSCAQNSKEIEGAWYWHDSTTTNVISLFFKDNGIVSRYSGPKKTMHPEDLKSGKYSLKNGDLIITWDDKTTETSTVKLINKNSIQITYEQQNKNPMKVLIFHKVFDEEVNKDDIPPEVKRLEKKDN